MTIKGYRIISNKLIQVTDTASSFDEWTGQLSDGFYTTFSTLQQGTRVVGLQSHFDRLYKPALELGLHPSSNEQTLRKQIVDLAKTFLPNESRIRLILTKDTGDIYLAIQPLTPPSESVYMDGVHVVTAQMARHDPRIKGTDFITQSAEQRKLVKGDIYEILLMKNGKVLEGMTSNFYAIKGKSLITAQRGILLGVTRRVVLRIARGEGMSIQYHMPDVKEKFDEAFLTSSSRGVVPIVMIDGKAVGQGSVGAWTKRLSLAYQTYVVKGSEKIIP